MLLVADLGREGVGQVGDGLKRSLLGGPPRTIWIVGMLLLAGLSQALVGIWQFGLRGEGPEHFIVLDRFYRAYGTYEQPNPFGGYMNLTVLAVLGYAGWTSHSLVGLAATSFETCRPRQPFFAPSVRVLLLTVVDCRGGWANRYWRCSFLGAAGHGWALLPVSRPWHCFGRESDSWVAVPRCRAYLDSFCRGQLDCCLML